MIDLGTRRSTIAVVAGDDAATVASAIRDRLASDGGTLGSIAAADALVVVASPGLTASPEVDAWIERRGTADVVLVHHDGDLIWDDLAGGDSPSVGRALPRTLVDRFVTEPVLLDGRGAAPERIAERVSRALTLSTAHHGEATALPVLADGAPASLAPSRRAVVAVALLVLAGVAVVGLWGVAAPGDDAAVDSPTTGSAPTTVSPTTVGSAPTTVSPTTGSAPTTALPPAAVGSERRDRLLAPILIGVSVLGVGVVALLVRRRTTRVSTGAAAPPPPWPPPPQVASVPPPGSGSPGLTFLSHDRDHDGPIADRLATSLRSFGPVWIAPQSIPPGKDWVEAIGDALDEARFVVLLVSEPALSSRWVRREMNVAIRLEVEGQLDALMPIRLDGCRPPALLRSYQIIDAASGVEAVAEQVGAVIRGR